MVRKLADIMFTALTELHVWHRLMSFFEMPNWIITRYKSYILTSSSRVFSRVLATEVWSHNAQYKQFQVIRHDGRKDIVCDVEHVVFEVAMISLLVDRTDDSFIPSSSTGLVKLLHQTNIFVFFTIFNHGFHCLLIFGLLGRVVVHKILALSGCSKKTSLLSE